MVSSIFETISEAVAGVVDVISDLMQSIVNIFYTTGEGGAGAFTFLGTIIIISLAAPLVFWAINWLVGLMRRVFARRS